MGVWPVLFTLFLFVATVKADNTDDKGEHTVTWKGDLVTMTCPKEGDWFMYDEKLKTKTKTYELTYTSGSRGLYKCEYEVTIENEKKEKKKETKTYFFYIKGKPCANCLELDGFILLCAIMGDVVATVLLMAVIYKCTKKKSSGGGEKTPQEPSRSGGRAAPATSSEYEQLNHSRSADPYSFVNRMG